MLSNMDKKSPAEWYVEIERLKTAGACDWQINNAIKNLAQAYENERCYFQAMQEYARLGNKREVRRLVQRCMQEDRLLDALSGYTMVGDEKNQGRLIDAIGQSPRDRGVQEFYFARYVGNDIIQSLTNNVNDWASEKGFDLRKYSKPILPSFNLAYNFAEAYDLGIGIARGGLELAYFFEKQGLPVYVVDAHRRGKGATFKWIDKPGNIEGKKVAVFDKDVVSGRTTRRVGRELRKLNPATLDLILRNPLSWGCLDPKRIPFPEQYNNLIASDSIVYENVAELKKRLLELSRK